MGKMSEDRRSLAADNTRLVGYVIARMGLAGNSEAYASGCLGLCRAAAAWKPERGRFTTFACKAIRNEVLDELRHEAAVRIGEKQWDGVWAVQNTEQEDGFLRLEEREEAAARAELVLAAARNLGERYREAARLLYTGESLSGAARRMGLSRQRVTQIVKKIRWAVLREEKGHSDWNG